LVSEEYKMKMITRDQNQTCIQKTTQNCLNQNFIKFMHKLQCTRYNQL